MTIMQKSLCKKHKDQEVSIIGKSFMKVAYDLGIKTMDGIFEENILRGRHAKKRKLRKQK